MLKIEECVPQKITKIVCPHCHKRLYRVGILDGGVIQGLTFRCAECGKLWEVTST